MRGQNDPVVKSHETAKKVGKSDNITLGKRGNSKAHSLSVLKRKAPELFQAGDGGGQRQESQTG
jgi:hypothetical protein